MRLLGFVFCAVLLGCSCILAVSGEAEKAGGAGDTITVFITGNELGAMKPCGCFGGQLGGLDRRGAVLDTAAPDRRLMLDTGNLVAGDSEQELIKFYIIVQAFGTLGYDVVRFTEKDIEAAKSQGMLQATGLGFEVITASAAPDANLPSKYTKKFSTKAGELVVNVGEIDTKGDFAARAAKLFGGGAKEGAVNILMVNDCNERVLEGIKKRGAIDCLICPSEGEEPIRTSKAGEKPMVISPGRLGKYVGVLRIKAVEGKAKGALEFEVKKVTEDLPQQKEQQKLYQEYQQMVKAAGLLEKHPKFALADELKYVGSEACNAVCHKEVYEKWRGFGHARAYATLEEVGSQYDPECVVCHVVGLNDESGFVSEEGPAGLRNVGCESCHGPGSEHVKNPYGAQTPGDSWRTCVTCHTVEHSAGFAGHEKEYLEKIRHWSEQNVDSNVKK